MRVSIWQQFSSNHSAYYAVVGEFQSVEEASAAAKTILQVAQQSGAWTMRNREHNIETKAITPFEQDLARQYSFDWKQPVDWFTYAGRDNAIQQWDRLLVIDTVNGYVDTWQSGHQFVNLLSAMGAKVARNVMEGNEPGVGEDIWISMGIEVTAEANSPEAAASICEELNRFVEEKRFIRASYRIPWLVFHPKLQDRSPAEIEALQTQFLSDEANSQSLHNKYPPQEFQRRWEEVRVLSREQWSLIYNCRRDLEIFGMAAKHTDEAIDVQGIAFADIVLGLPALIAYLRDKGCTDVKYTVHQY